MIKTGVLLPHFGSDADFGLIREGATRAEELGFDSVWVRDHLLYEPHAETDDVDQTFFEASVVLAAVAASTKSLELGTSAWVPLRHPLMTAKIMASLSSMFGRKIHLGLGAGGFDHEFAALGYPASVPRRKLVDATMQTCRALWAGESVSLEDEVFSFSEVAMQPAPAPGAIDLWLCGSGSLAAKRAATSYDGWMPARITLAALTDRLDSMREISAAAGRARPTCALLGLSSIAASREEAMSRIPLDGLLSWANENKFAQTWPKPASGRYEKPEDISGMYIGGNPDDVIEQCAKIVESGVSHIVFDLRSGFSSWVEQIDLLGSAVLPELARLTVSAD